MKRSHYNICILLCFFCIAFISCNDNEGLSNKEDVIHKKVAIIMPDANNERWHRIVDWAIDDINAAQQGLPQQVVMDIDWINEDSQDWETQLTEIVDNDDYTAIVGPMSSMHAQRAAEICDENDKTLILPIATSTEFQHMYAGRRYVWNLTQSDITQCELLLTQVKLSEKSDVTLIASKDNYGNSFIDWFGFLATQLGMQVDNIYNYQSDKELQDCIDIIYNTKDKYNKAVIFAPGNKNDALVLDKELCRLKNDNTGSYFDFPMILCSDVVNNSSILSKLQFGYYEGLAPSAAPESGFHAIYLTKFAEEPISGEAQLYDAILLLAYSYTHQIAHQSTSLNESIIAVVDGDSPWNGSWLRDDLRSALLQIQQGASINLCGVSSDWSFDKKTHASVLNSTYSHWIYSKGKLSTLEFLSTDGSINTISTIQAWECQIQNLQEFQNTANTLDYPALKDHWAVVISGSDDWENYRHQADALAMYQLLKKHGYDDDHIILIMEDNIAHHPKNIYPGVVKVKPDGENLYTDVKVDYKLSEINPNDLKNIMLGIPSERMPQVIRSGAHDNILIYWCGHGDRKSLDWGSHNWITGQKIQDILSAMNQEKKYRKIFFTLDACYSGIIGEACQGLPGVAVFTSANSIEPSKADMKDTSLGIYLSNGFTRSFQETIDQNKDISLRNLYYQTARQTFGSHAMLYNIENYGNVFKDSMSEYFIK